MFYGTPPIIMYYPTPAPISEQQTTRLIQDIQARRRTGGTIVFPSPCPEMEIVMPKALELIETERARQIQTEGWTLEHDDRHQSAELEEAANCYWFAGHSQGNAMRIFQGSFPSARWPWEWRWFKPWSKSHVGPVPQIDPIKCLTKAGALLMAERDRYGRKADTDNVKRINGRIEIFVDALQRLLPTEPEPVQPIEELNWHYFLDKVSGQKRWGFPCADGVCLVWRGPVIGGGSIRFAAVRSSDQVSDVSPQPKRQ